MMSENLNEYNLKRNFEKTLEPEGRAEDENEKLRFVVQYHMARSKHYDLRLEWKGVLLSWAVPKGPSYDTHHKRLAVHVENHPLDYRNFEGTIPKGEYGGGVVMLWDEGFWEPYVNVEEGLDKGELKFSLMGRRLKGKWALVRWAAKSGEDVDNWLLLKEKDEYVKAEDYISQYITSIRTGRTIAEIEKGEDEKIAKNPFSSVNVQLAKLAGEVPNGDDWLYEMKFDGYRIVAFVEGNNVRLMTRNGNDYARRFYDIVTSLMDWAGERAMVLDGEITVTDPSGKTDFQALQNYMKNHRTGNLIYIVFDILSLDGADLRGNPLIERKEILENLMKDAPENLYYSRHVIGNGKESLSAACGADMEGIVGKKADSVYSGTRNGDWIKLKCAKRQEFVIGGYTLSDKRISGVSSLLLGVYEGDELVYAGRAGTGISEGDMKDLEERFKKLKRINSPFKTVPETRSHEQITWLEPELIAEIKFAQWTNDDLLRQASYKGIRTDKNPKDIRRERADKESEEKEALEAKIEVKPEVKSNMVVEGIKITNPNKVLFDDSQITKGTVVQYYSKVSERMLPYLRNRVLTTVRCPKGIEQTCFFKKHPGSESKGVITISVPSDNGETEDFFYIEDVSGLISEAQMGALEFHCWGSDIENLEKPSIMVFDLDPDEGLDINRVRQGALDIKDVLAELSLNSYLKVSGGKGYHVVVPLKPSVSWEVFYDFARGVVQVMEQKWPERYTGNVRKAKRKNKIFIDWIRNGRGATSIAPYSLRARKGARVSMPISWDELITVAPDGITMSDALSRIAGDDPWKDFFDNNQMLK